MSKPIPRPEPAKSESGSSCEDETPQQGVEKPPNFPIRTTAPSRTPSSRPEICERSAGAGVGVAAGVGVTAGVAVAAGVGGGIGVGVGFTGVVAGSTHSPFTQTRSPLHSLSDLQASAGPAK